MNKKARERIARVQQNFKKHLVEYRQALAELIDKKISDGDIEQVKQLAHRLAGSGTTFGYRELSTIAGALEKELERDQVSSTDETIRDHMYALLSALDHCVKHDMAAPPRNPVSEQPIKGNKLVYLLEDDLDLAAFIAGELLIDSYQVSLFHSVEQIHEAVLQVEPSAIIVDIILEGDEFSGVSWVQQLRASGYPDIPIIYLSQKSDFETRLRAVRSGTNFYLQKPVLIDQLKFALHECLFDKPYEPYRVLIVDDDATLAEAFSHQLEHAGVTTQVLLDPTKVVTVIEQFNPELILLDVNMPGCSGIEAGQVIRQIPRYGAIPIVFLSTVSDPKKQLDAIRLAGDDFIEKPITTEELTVNVTARLKRARLVSLYKDQLGQEIAHQKLHDYLTGLPNKSYLEAKINEAIAELKQKPKQSIALLWIDIDNFSSLNDVFGHELGDNLIVEVANRIQIALRETDFLCRQGGDEFAVLLKSVKTREDIKALTRLISQVFRSPFDIEGQQVRVSLSIGLSICPEHTTDAKDLIKKADMALFHAKTQGRNQCLTFSTEMEKNIAKQLRMENELRQAINRQQLHLVFQPKYHAKTKEVVGAEALLRWTHPELGAVSPADFIPLAENTGLITEIARWVLRSCCEHLQHWQQQNLEVKPVAINLSARDFLNKQFVELLMHTPADYGVDNGLLELEITERTIANKESALLKTLEKLHNHGFSLAIDDFGTGYSSMSYLKKMPIDLLKIDQSFIKDIPDDQDDCVITEAIINLGKNLSVSVLAEGVERQEQLDFLNKMECDYIQGYLFAKPLSPEDFAKKLNPIKH